MHHEGLRFFNRLHGVLRPGPDGLQLELRVQDGVALRTLGEPELERPVFPHLERLALASALAPGRVVAHLAPGGQGFTVADLARAVERTEAEARQGPLAGSPAVFLEGLTELDGVWLIGWGA